ncbi:tRNA threonylcarbamoyladenosine dehydratase [Gracilinema caldarium]|nr:tRNA threonylcarbamoyladenosine dehydratase [Gracilinema caldarium]
MRTELILGSEALQVLKESRVAVFGLGGVGGMAAEALARSGVGRLLLVDFDVVSITNLNRQVIALHSTIGKPKAQVMQERILDINPQAQVEARQETYTPARAESFFSSPIDYVVDAIDMVSAKIDLILRSQARGIPIISSMGTGNKLDPSKLEVADIYETSTCPLARVLRRELKKRGVRSLTVVYSRESPVVLQNGERAFTETDNPGKHLPGSTAFVPPAAGLLIASWVVRDLVHRRVNKDFGLS